MWCSVMSENKIWSFDYTKKSFYLYLTLQKNKKNTINEILKYFTKKHLAYYSWLIDDHSIYIEL